MYKALAVVALLVVTACGSSSKEGTPPVISEFTMASPVAAGSASVTGSVYVTDTAGLADLTLDITLSGDGVNTTLTSPVQGGSSSETAAMVPIVIALSSAIPAGTYTVKISLEQDGAASNSLTAPVVVQ